MRMMTCKTCIRESQAEHPSSLARQNQTKQLTDHCQSGGGAPCSCHPHSTYRKNCKKRVQQVGSDTLAKINRRTLLWWAQICRRETKVDFTSHRLRHTFATDAVGSI